ncbi:MAG: twin-arginine translocase TatA/TatE family subunit [Deltaproteobacteria bacterium]|jgi:Tat protein translocase TatB subunit|nr:twin-arginine translocase TatA/TatE family subunit [Deltaproteobacteria bacterium]
MAPGIGLSEIVFIVLIALIVVKPEKLPETLSKLFKFLKEIRSYIGGLKDSLGKELSKFQTQEALKDLKNLKNDMRDLKNGLESPISGQDENIFDMGEIYGDFEGTLGKINKEEGLQKEPITATSNEKENINSIDKTPPAPLEEDAKEAGQTEREANFKEEKPKEQSGTEKSQAKPTSSKGLVP